MPMEKVTQAQTIYRDIFVGVIAVDEDEAALRVAGDLAAGADGRVTATLVTPLPEVLYALDNAYSPIISADILAQCREDGEDELKRLNTRLAAFTAPTEARHVAGDLIIAGEDVTNGVRHADLAVFGRPQGADDARRPLIVGALFGAGRPVLVVPSDWKKGGTIENVLIAWNASKESARAVADAAPFLSMAKAVRIVTVDAKPTPAGHGDAPGADIAAHLARRGLTVDLVNLPAAGQDEGAVIAAEAVRFGADLLVLGGYGHSRLREMVFGGVTKYLLAHGATPMLFSH